MLQSMATGRPIDKKTKVLFAHTNLQVSFDLLPEKKLRMRLFLPTVHKPCFLRSVIPVLVLHISVQVMQRRKRT